MLGDVGMKFTFKKHIAELILWNLFFNLIIIIFFILFAESMIAITFLVFVLFCINVDLFRDICKIKNFLKSQSEQKIINLEIDISNSKLVYDSWRLTDEYMFSLKEFKEISYQDIIVVEGGLTLVRGYGGNTIGYKQKIYLKNGEVYKLKSVLTSSDSDLFKEIILKKNPNIYFGIIEEYLKNRQKQEKINIEK